MDIHYFWCLIYLSEGHVYLWVAWVPSCDLFLDLLLAFSAQHCQVCFTWPSNGVITFLTIPLATKVNTWAWPTDVEQVLQAQVVSGCVASVIIWTHASFRPGLCSCSTALHWAARLVISVKTFPSWSAHVPDGPHRVPHVKSRASGTNSQVTEACMVQLTSPRTNHSWFSQPEDQQQLARVSSLHLPSLPPLTHA